MRISIIGTSESAAVLRGKLRKSGFVIVEENSRYDYRVYLEEVAGLAYTTVDGIDSTLEANIVNKLEQHGIEQILLKRAGGIRSDRSIKIIFAPIHQEQIEAGIYDGLRIELGVVIPKEKSKKRATKTITGMLVVTATLAAIFGYAASASPSDMVDLYSVNPTLYQVTNFPIVRFWSGSVVVNAGDSVNNALRVNCILGCGGGPGGGLTDAELRASPVPVSFTTPIAVTGTFFQATQPVSSTQLPAALVGGRLDSNIGAWLGSTAPTVGQKTMANSVPTVLASDQAAIPVTNTNLDVALSTRLKPADTLTAVTTVTTVSTVTAVSSVNAVIPGTGATSLGKAEDVVHTTGDTGVAAWGVRTDPTTTAYTTAATEYSPIAVDYVGATPSAVHPGRFSCFVPLTATVTTQCQAAPAAGLRAYVTSVSISNGAASAQTVDVVFGTGAACVTGITALTHKWQLGTLATTTNQMDIEMYFGTETPLVPTAANAICCRPSAATAFGCTITGFIAP